MKRNDLFAIAVLFTILAATSHALAQGNAFTYQGRLNSGTNPANGNYDLRFNLYSDDGSVFPPTPALTSPITITNLGVTNGLFTVTLNFGATFPGADRWLEILVRTNGGGAFTTLSPRQKLTPAPYAITAGNVTAGGGLSGIYSNAVTLNNAANTFTGNGAGLTALNAGNIASGTLSDSRLSANVALRAGGNAFTGNQTVTSGSLGIGTTNPGARLEIAQNYTGGTAGMIHLESSGTEAGLSLEKTNGGTQRYSLKLVDSANGFGIRDETAGGALRLQIRNGSGNVGIGTINPQSALHVAGTVTADNFLSSTAGVEPPSGITPILNMIWIVPGTFVMGSPASEQDRLSDEGSQTVVTITKGFWMGHHEVTQGEYQSLMGTNPSSFAGNLTMPVERVSWHDATNFCATLTQREFSASRLASGWVYRLPTEAQWEYACRALTTSRFHYGDDLAYASLTNYAWFEGNNSPYGTKPIGQKLGSPWGLVDMHGNVWEWCQDWYGSYPGGSVTDPQGPGAGSKRVIRGGSWIDQAWQCRSAKRYNGWDPASATSFIGFRVVLAPGQP